MEDRRTLPVGDEEAPKVVAVRLVGRVDGREVGSVVLHEQLPSVTVGSAQGHGLVIDHPTVSRDHLEARLRPGGVLVRDLGSTNGTRYHGSRVQEVLVPLGAAMLLGNAEVRVELAEAPLATRLGCLASLAPSMVKAIEQLAKAAPTEATMLLEGETGSGKEIAARAIHEASPRAANAFEVVDCGALPRDLAGSELFGHVKGAFTGAVGDKAGAFERAHGGTLFLDEIGELPLEQQPLLLRVLEAREVRRVGAASYRTVDVRIIAATNRDLDTEAKQGRFRQDLMHRLAVVRVRLPPLRERLEDIPLLSQAIVDAMGSRAAGFSLSPETLRLLVSYGWPGNIRELRNLIERSVALSGDHTIDPRDLGLAPGATVKLPLDYRQARDLAMDSFERDYLVHLLRSCDRNVSRAAREAGIDRVYLHRLIKKHGIVVSGL